MTDKEDRIFRELINFKEQELRLLQKFQDEKYKRYHQELDDFLSSGFKVVTGQSLEEMLRQLLQMIKHAEGIWDDATLLFSRNRYATSCFLSIVCIEECAKIKFGEFQIDSSFLYPKTSSTSPRGKNPLRHHVRKQFLAACSGVLVNPRMEEVLGAERVATFISDCEKGKLEELRQSCLYVDVGRGGQTVYLPSDQITKEQALFYASLAGELLDAVSGTPYSMSGGLRDKVDRFEKKNRVLSSM
jgi:AbiV family abortive infection protein